MDKIKYHLEQFDGPLDLLLELIKKHKINIDNIQITLLIDQYLAAMDSMEEYNMDIASEFLEMSARLIYMKSIALLPQNKEIQKLKKELTQQIMDYKECKMLAKNLAQKANFDSFIRVEEKVDIDYKYKLKHNISELFNAYSISFKKAKNHIENISENLSKIVSKKIISVYSRIIYIFKLLKKNKCCAYESIFDSSITKSSAVATFLALLELIKNKRVRAEYQDNILKIFLNRKRCDKNASREH